MTDPALEPSGLPTADTVEQILRAIEATDIAVVEMRYGSVQVRVEQEAEPSFHLPPSGVPPESSSTGMLSVLAPLTGVYYARPSPDQPVFVEVGSTVAPGQVVGLIETMKLFNEILAEVEGQVGEICAAEGDLVESGQVLMRLKPRGEV